MLTFKQIEYVDGFYHYEIYPEGEVKDKGILIFNPDTKTLKKKVEPDSPFDCIGHFLQGVKDENGNYRKEGMTAWY